MTEQAVGGLDKRAAAGAMPAAGEAALFGRVLWRIMPLLVLTFIMSYVDRQNVAFAKLQMVKALGMSEVAYGLGSSLFFIGYMIFDIPSALAGHRFGARVWMARIMATWGLITLVLAFTQSANMFFGLRFLLGAAEGGFYPVGIYYVALWFPKRYRVQALGIFTLGAPLGSVVGSAFGGLLLDLGGTLGLAGWQWVFIATGVPAILLAGIVILLLPAVPQEATFLSAEEKAVIAAAHARDASDDQPAHGNPLVALWDPKVLLFGVIYILMSTSLYGVNYWLPTVVKEFGVSSSVNGFLNVIPWALAVLALLVVPQRLKGDRALVRGVVLMTFIGLVLFAFSTLISGNTARFIAISVGAPCIQLLYPCFWATSTRFFAGARAAASIAAINAIGLLGGFAAQNLMPIVATATGHTVAAMTVPAVCLALIGLMAIGLGGRLQSRAIA